MAERMMTYLKPGKTDVLGDRWASQVRELYDKALDRLGIPKIGDGMGAVWNLFQYQYCEMADMRCRVVSSPQAMAMCGWKLEDRHFGLSEQLLYASSDILEEESKANA